MSTSHIAAISRPDDFNEGPTAAERFRALTRQILTTPKAPAKNQPKAKKKSKR